MMETRVEEYSSHVMTQEIFHEEVECMPRTVKKSLCGQREPLAIGDLWQCLDSVGHIL